MCAALIGKVDWDALHYVYEARENGTQVETLSGDEARISITLLSADFIVLVTDKTSHKSRREVLAAVRGTDVPIYMRHSCGLNSVSSLFESHGE